MVGKSLKAVEMLQKLKDALALTGEDDDDDDDGEGDYNDDPHFVDTNIR